MAADILQRVGDLNRLERFLSGTVVGSAFAAATLLVFVGVAAFYSGAIAMVYVATAVASVAWLRALSKRRAALDGLIAAHPNVTAIDTTPILAQIQHVLEQVIGAVQFLFAFTLAAGLLVLYAALAGTRDRPIRRRGGHRSSAGCGGGLCQGSRRRSYRSSSGGGSHGDPMEGS